MELQKARLENWELVSRREDYRAYGAVRGEVYGHPKFEDGTVVVTSYIVDSDLEARWVQSSNTLYTLGVPHPKYVAWVKEHAPGQAEKYGLTTSALKPRQESSQSKTAS